MSAKTETKVGALVLSAAAGLVWLTTQSGDIGGASMDELRVLSSDFTNAGGLVAGAPVKIAGVKVGDVRSIKLTPQGTARVTFTVRDDIDLPANISTQVTADGLIGGKHLALVSDFGSEGQLAETTQTLPSIGVNSMDNLAEKFGGIAEDISQVSKSLRTALGGPENAEKLSRIINNLDGIGSKLNDVLVNEIKEGQIENIVDNISDFSDALNDTGDDILYDLKSSAASLKTILGNNEGKASELISNLSVTADNLASITNNMREGKGILGKMLTQDSNALENLEIAAKDIREIAERVNNGEGTIGRLINDPATVEKIETALDSISGAATRIQNFKTEVDFHGYSLVAEDSISKGRFSVKLQPRPNRFYVLGITADGFATDADDPRSSGRAYAGQDFGNETKFTVQFGHIYEAALFNKDVALRLGVKDSTFGIGADMVFNAWADHKLEVSADVYDLSGENSGTSADKGITHVDLTARLHMSDTGLYAIGGIDNALHDKYSSPFLGLGWRFRDEDLKFLAGAAL